MKIKQILAVATVVLAPAAAAADCGIWALEDSSAGGQRRARIFAWSDLVDRDALIAEAAGIAIRAAQGRNLHFVDVFLTRPQDGMTRADHSAATSTVWMRFNPGNTPVLKTRMEAQALTDGASAAMQFGMFTGERISLAEDEILAIVESAPAGVALDCPVE